MKQHKLTIAQFYNWMDILDEDEPKPNFMIWRVEVSRFDVLCYTSNRIGNALLRTSNELMEPGEYVPFGEYRHLIPDNMFHRFIKLDDENPGIKVIGSWPKPTFRGRENIVRERMKDYPRAGLRLDHVSRESNFFLRGYVQQLIFETLPHWDRTIGQRKF